MKLRSFIGNKEAEKNGSLKGTQIQIFSHLTTNSRRRKKTILSLEEKGENITDPEQIK